MILNLEHIYKDYIQGKMTVPVLKDVNLKVEKGEYVAIMGPSGSGKSTLMNIVGCLDRPTSGSYELAGKDIRAMNDRQLAEVRLRSIGFVFQNFQLLPRMSALDNVALPLVYAGIRKKIRRERAREALVRVGLEDRVNFKPTQLSGGQKQRVAIARAMVNKPDLLLADEPTGALDSKSSKQVMELFQSLNEEGVTVVMITHDSGIAAHAKRVVTIFDGELTELPPEQQRAPEKVFSLKQPLQEETKKASSSKQPSQEETERKRMSVECSAKLIAGKSEELVEKMIENALPEQPEQDTEEKAAPEPAETPDRNSDGKAAAEKSGSREKKEETP